MKQLQRGIVIGAVLAAFLSAIGCGGGSGSDSSAVIINTLDGQTDIPVNSTFQYNFAQMINTSTVTASSFFILPEASAAAQTVKAAYDPTSCNAANALAASITCESTTQCTINPDADLEGGERYSICLSPEIQLTGGTAFEGFMATFTTAGGAAPTASLKLVRLDGTKLDLTAKPIPRRVAVEATFSVPMDQATVEAAMTVTDDAGTAIPGTFSWSADSTVATYTLSKNLGYKGTYHVKIAATASSKGTMAAVDQTFVTMTRGDVNGDGYTDVVTGAFGTDVAGGADDGSVYVFSGATIAGNHGVDAAMATINSAEQDAQFGWGVSAAGDINGDGYADVIGSALTADGGHSNRGVTYLFSGATLTGTVTTAAATASFIGSEDNAGLGDSVAILGDINNDGCDEVGTSSRNLNMGGTARGGAYIFAGSPTISGAVTAGPTTALASIRGEANNDWFGYSIAGAGDINGDGTPDVIIGAPFAPNGTGVGAAYVFSGATLTGEVTASASTALAKIVGAAGDNFGNSVDGPGDINGDGRDDIALTAYRYGGNAGAAYFFDGATLSGSKAAGEAFANITGNAVGDEMGYYNRGISGIGDFNADGHVDIIVGAAEAPGGGFWGKAYVFSGAELVGPKTVGDAFISLIATKNDELGYYVSGGGDVNADGVPDFAVSADYYDDLTYNGIIYVFSGATLSPTTSFTDAYATIVGAAGNDYLSSVSAQ